MNATVIAELAYWASVFNIDILFCSELCDNHLDIHFYLYHVYSCRSCCVCWTVCSDYIIKMDHCESCCIPMRKHWLYSSGDYSMNLLMKQKKSWHLTIRFLYRVSYLHLSVLNKYMQSSQPTKLFLVWSFPFFERHMTFLWYEIFHIKSKICVSYKEGSM